MFLWTISQVSTPDTVEWVNLIGSLGSAGFAIWFGAHVTTKTIPNMQADHRAQIEDLRRTFQTDCKEQRELFEQEMERQREMCRLEQERLLREAREAQKSLLDELKEERAARSRLEVERAKESASLISSVNRLNEHIAVLCRHDASQQQPPLPRPRD